MNSLPDGTLLQGGKYRIVKFIGAGGFGCTYEAVFELLGERVAIKEFFPHELCNRDATGRMSVGTDSRVEFVSRLRKKFVDEARTLFNYKDIDGVVKVTDVFEENSTSYFVMDFIDGKSLQNVIKYHGPMLEEEALRIISEAGRALQKVHDRGCLHLDLKPDNIMLDAGGHPILIDFGVSKQYTSEDGCNTSTLMGCTPGYAPLEQLKGNVRAFTPATDIYAFGATLYALLTGKTPPDASDLLNDEAILEFPSGISVSTRNAIKAAMQSKVKDRPSSVDAFLALIPKDSGEKTRPASFATKTQIVSAKPPRSRRYLWTGLAAIVIFIAAIIAWRVNVKPKTSVDQGTISLVETDTIVNTDTIMIEQAVAVPSIAPTPTAQEASEPTEPALSQQRAAIVSVPAASASTETAMVAAFTDDGKYRAYTVSDWNGFTPEQKAKLKPVGVQLTSNGQQFIIAPTDAAQGKTVKWEDKESYDDCVTDIGNLVNVDYPDLNSDYNGGSNTNKIISFSNEMLIKYPAAEAAVEYRGLEPALKWCLPASGQLFLIFENKSAVEDVMIKINGFLGDGIVWSSSEMNSKATVVINMSTGDMHHYWKYATGRVRAVAPVPSAAI